MSQTSLQVGTASLVLVQNVLVKTATWLQEHVAASHAVHGGVVKRFDERNWNNYSFTGAASVLQFTSQDLN